jgi:hypothetical protein
MRALKPDPDNVGDIYERQTTFVRFENSETRRRATINFKNKMEFRIDPGTFVGVSVLDRHPLLEQYEYTNTSVYVSSKASDASSVASDISNAIRSHFQGWRSADDYCNAGYGLKRILEEGSGLVYEGPPSGAEVVKFHLKQNGITYTSPTSGRPTGKKFKVLMPGKNFVVAEDFGVEENET